MKKQKRVSRLQAIAGILNLPPGYDADKIIAEGRGKDGIPSRKRAPLTRRPKLTDRVMIHLSSRERRELQKLARKHLLTESAMMRAIICSDLMIRNRRNRGIPGDVLYGAAIGEEQIRAGLSSPCMSSLNEIQDVSTKRTVADLVLNPLTHVVTRGGKPIELSALEFRLLHYLMSRAGEVVSRADISRKVWVKKHGKNSNVIDVYISYLRNKIERNHKKKLIHTIRGAGVTVDASRDRGGHRTAERKKKTS